LFERGLKKRTRKTLKKQLPTQSDQKTKRSPKDGLDVGNPAKILDDR